MIEFITNGSYTNMICLRAMHFPGVELHMLGEYMVMSNGSIHNTVIELGPDSHNSNRRICQ